jgi:hypothetical protein
VSYVELIENRAYGGLEPKVKAQASSAQRARQATREPRTGRYEKVPCSSCSLGAPMDAYVSHRDTDGPAPNGIGDALIRLCEPCAEYLDQFDGPQAVIEAAKIRATGKRAPRRKKERDS